MPFPSDFETLADTRLFIKAGRPTDNTEAAFETYFGTASLEFDVTQVGVIEGREYNTAELDVVNQGLVRRKLGNYALPQSEWGVLSGEDGDAANDAYEAARTAMQDKSIVSFAAVRQSGAVLYWTAQVMNLTDSGGGSNDSLTYAMTLLFQTEALKATTPVVPTV
jgi:hypothetical protein